MQCTSLSEREVFYPDITYRRRQPPGRGVWLPAMRICSRSAASQRLSSGPERLMSSGFHATRFDWSCHSGRASSAGSRPRQAANASSPLPITTLTDPFGRERACERCPVHGDEPEKHPTAAEFSQLFLDVTRT